MATPGAPLPQIAQDHPSDSQQSGHGRGTRGVRGFRGERGSRGPRGGGRGITASSQSRMTSARPATSSPSRPAPPSAPITVPKTTPNPAIASEPQTAADTDEADICFICASDVVHQCLTPCNHRTCHICGLRMRALYKNKDCPHCRTPAPYVIFTDDSNKRFEDFKESDFEKTHDNLGIKYEKTEIYDDTVLLLQYNCPESSCAHVCRSWDDLYHHVGSVHRRNICRLCLKFKKVFAHEHELFTLRELRKHERSGDDNPGSVDQSGFKGHPECGFCSERFYGDDELYAHCRDKHEKCHICERQSTGGRPQYYLNYDELERHFAKDHFICTDAECLEKKFVVFGSEMDLKAHQLEVHPNGLSKDARRDARRVDISNFDYRTGYQEPRGGRRGRGRGRDPNAEPLPTSSAQPLRRDELAYQRQMDLLNQQNAAPALTPRQPPPRPSFHMPVVQMERLNIDTDPSPNLTPQEQARQIQHNAVIARASALLKNDATKLGEFRKRVSSYRQSTVNATELVDGFFHLFVDCSSTDMGKLIKELADIYENQAKRDALLQAWNDWKAINEDYPSLPGLPEGLQPSQSETSTAGRRILKLKSSTAKSSRSATNSQVAWAGGHTQSATPGSNAMAFPSLATANRATAGRGTTTWATSAATVSNSGPTTSNGRSSTAVLARGADAFPALPAAVKPSTHQLGIHRGKVGFWDEKAPTGGNPWGGGGTPAGASANASAAASEAEDQDTTAKGKKGRKGKQTLFKYG